MDEDEVTCGIEFSERCAKPFSKLQRRRFAGGGEEGFGLIVAREVVTRLRGSSSSGLTVSRCFRFIITVSNHGWRMCVDVAQVVLIGVGSRSRGRVVRRVKVSIWGQ